MPICKVRALQNTCLYETAFDLSFVCSIDMPCFIVLSKPEHICVVGANAYSTSWVSNNDSFDGVSSKWPDVTGSYEVTYLHNFG